MEKQDENLIKQHLKRRAKRRLFLWLFGSSAGLITLGITLFLTVFLLLAAGSIDDSSSDTGGGETFTGEYSEGLSIYKEIKGRGPFSDEIAQYAVGAAVKYKLLPSVILSQYGYESAFGTSLSAREDTNFFGITWFDGCLFPKGTARGIGGSEGGWYMKFPNPKVAFSFYGFMVATQSNFNACVGNKSPGADLLVLGRGGYAAAGIIESSPYYIGAMNIITSNKLTEYDEFAIKHWGEGNNDNGTITGEWTNPFPGSLLDRSSFQSYQLFGTNPGGEFRLNGFHDGLDFGSVDHPGSEVHAVHGGKVVFVGNPGISELGACVIVINDGGLNMIYQEFASSTSDARVKVGDQVKVGQVIGTRDTDHLHLGITRMDWRQAEAHAFTDDGTWIDPLTLLNSGKK
ncbi:peptidase, M23 family [Enterococcus faecalis 13-SD-W-01]|nr:peptidase, M23 family [Enterococcus faecalis 13-SD-W-01]